MDPLKLTVHRGLVDPVESVGDSLLSGGVSGVACKGHVSPDPGGVDFAHLLLPTLGSPCPAVKDHRIEFPMMQLPDESGVTLMQYSPWVWHVSRAGKHVGTISGDRVGGFTARDIHFESIGRGYASTEAAVKAWAPRTGRHL